MRLVRIILPSASLLLAMPPQPIPAVVDTTQVTLPTSSNCSTQRWEIHLHRNDPQPPPCAVLRSRASLKSGQSNTASRTRRTLFLSLALLSCLELAARILVMISTILASHRHRIRHNLNLFSSTCTICRPVASDVHLGRCCTPAMTRSLGLAPLSSLSWTDILLLVSRAPAVVSFPLFPCRRLMPRRLVVLNLSN